MNKKILVLLFLLLPLAIAIPENMNVNGEQFTFLILYISIIVQKRRIARNLTDSGRIPLSGNYQITLKIYNVASGGTALWNSTNQSVTTDSDGVFLNNRMTQEYLNINYLFRYVNKEFK